MRGWGQACRPPALMSLDEPSTVNRPRGREEVSPGRRGREEGEEGEGGGWSSWEEVEGGGGGRRGRHRVEGKGEGCRLWALALLAHLVHHVATRGPWGGGGGAHPFSRSCLSSSSIELASFISSASDCT